MTPLRQESESSGEDKVPQTQRRVIARLRGLIPTDRDAISYTAASHVATAQAAAVIRLAKSSGLDTIAFISTLPNIHVEVDAALPDSSASHWNARGEFWTIVIRGGDPIAHQRFAIAHEFKRILDHGHQALLYDPRHIHNLVQCEMAADRFAACVLMPPRAFRAAVRSGADVDVLASTFGVSDFRVVLRLSDLDLHINPTNPERREL